MAKKIAKVLLLLVLLVSTILVCTSCGTKEIGMQAACDSIQELHSKSKFLPHVNCTYDQAEDKLTISLDGAMDLKKLFASLNKSVDGAKLGHLAFESLGGITLAPDFSKEFGEYLTKLPCESIECLSIADEYLQGETWTGILDRTKSMFEPNLDILSEYSSESKKNLVNLKKIIILDNNKNYSLGHIDILSGLEEISLSAGLTEEDRAAFVEELKKAYSRDSRTTAVNESVINSGIYRFAYLQKLKNLKSVLIFPELSDQMPDIEHCLNLLSLQTYAPQVYTNKPGKAYGGDEADLIPVKDMDVLDYSNNRVVTSAIDYCLFAKAKACYEKAQNFTETVGVPIIRGKCLIYMATPKMFDSNHQALDDFYDNNRQILSSELIDSPTSPADDVTTFVYVFPKYRLAGRYTDGTTAYTTIEYVSVYDMEKGIHYTTGIAGEVEPPKSIYSDGSGGSLHANMRPDDICTYLEGLL